MLYVTLFFLFFFIPKGFGNVASARFVFESLNLFSPCHFCANPRNELCAVMRVLKEFAASVGKGQMPLCPAEDS